jgi:predicted HTH transcriptional regulator
LPTVFVTSHDKVVQGKVRNKELRDIFSITRQAMLKEISKLIDAKLIELVGKGRNAYYKISD